MQRVAEGNLSQPVIVRAKDEIKFLISSFNQMSHDLKVSQEKLVNAERLAAWQDIARKVSHEIKNALTPIQLSLRRLISRLEPDDQTEIEEPLTTIQEEVASLRRLAEEFTTFSRLPQTNLKPENLNDLIRKVTTLIEAEPHLISLKLELDESIPPISLDREQMRRALHNIIKNSIEASERGSSIFIQTKRMDQENRTVLIAIQDHGSGMDPEVLSKIFEPYFTTKNRGMGLGLSIVKRIIEDHNGEIVFESAPGRGTQVAIYL
jgi:two-component system nitrogen regulation sensor histidine kinase NtrY